jgi:hypothetical protein
MDIYSSLAILASRMYGEEKNFSGGGAEIR